MKPGDKINLREPRLEKNSTTFLAPKNHVFASHNQNEGSIREEAVGGLVLKEAIDSYTNESLRKLFSRRGMVRPDISKHQSMQVNLQRFVDGVDTTEPTISIVKTITENITNNDLFKYSGVYTSPLN